MIQQVAEVLAYRRLGEEYHVLTIGAPEIARTARPGQFVNLRPPPGRSFLLRRPFSIYRLRRGAAVEVGFDVRGPGTAALAELRPSDPIDVVGPIGTGFGIAPERQRCLLVGGGVGATPLFFLADELAAAGKRVDLLFGASTASRLVNVEEGRRLGASLEIVTEDASLGQRGIVTDLLGPMIERCGSEVVYACGPNPMLAAVSRVAAERGVPVEVAVEELMGCGIGICMSCVAPVWNEDATQVVNVRTCVEGPVFDGTRVAWKAYEAGGDTDPAPPGN
jgi:dihydroorotate dehydrogenase electron transfer subunit